MGDIIEFNSGKKQKAADKKSSAAYNHLNAAEVAGSQRVVEAYQAYFASLPQNDLMAEAINLVAEMNGRLMLYTTVVAKASELIESAGLDPDNFELDEDSYARFMQIEIEDIDPDAALNEETLNSRENIWNGVWFDWEDVDITYRVATTMIIGAQGLGALGMDLLRKGWDDDNWEIFNEGEWVEGPPEDVFEFLVTEREDMLDDDDDGVYEWFDDEDDEEWENSIDSMLLSPSVVTALHGAGVYTIDELREMSDEELLKIKGIGKARVAEIREALEYED